MAAVEVHDIVKSYRKGAVQALHGVSFEAGHGEIFGIIGPDGAGKTSLFRILTTLILPDSGTASVDGLDIVRDYKAIRNCVGYMPGRFSLYQDMTVEENLTFFATVFGTTIRENYHLIKDIYSQIEPFKDRKAGALSGGMKQRLGIAQAMLNDPEILVLDEPTAGLDPKERVRFRNLISSFSKDKIVLLSTHIVSDIEYIANEILVMKAGKLVHQGKPEEVTKEITGFVWECRVPASEADRWNEKYTIGNLRNEGDYSILRVISERKPAGNAVPVKPVLEDLYLYYFEEENS